MTGLFRKVVLVVIDGLRPDAITAERMPVLQRHGESGMAGPSGGDRAPECHRGGPHFACERCGSGHARPDRGAAASPAAGAPPPPAARGASPPWCGDNGHYSGAVRGLPLAGWSAPPARGCHPPGARTHRHRRLCSSAAARRIDGNQGRELVVVYVNDTDLAGHAWGWMSEAYLQAARTVDRALARILPLVSDPETLWSSPRRTTGAEGFWTTTTTTRTRSMTVSRWRSWAGGWPRAWASLSRGSACSTSLRRCCMASAAPHPVPTMGG